MRVIGPRRRRDPRCDIWVRSARMDGAQHLEIYEVSNFLIGILRHLFVHRSVWRLAVMKDDMRWLPVS